MFVNINGHVSTIFLPNSWLLLLSETHSYEVLMKQLLDLFVRSYTDQEYVRDANF